MTDIAVLDLNPRTQLVDAVGGTVSYAYNFLILDEDELVVEHTVALTGITSTLTIAVDYTVAGVEVETGGTITLVVATAINDVITLWRDVPVRRLNDYPTQGDFAAATINKELDLMTMQMQQLERDIDRSLHITPSDPSTTMELPGVDTRKGQYLFFDAVDGTPSVAQNLSTGVAVISGFMDPILASADQAAAQASFGIKDEDSVWGVRGADVAAAVNLPILNTADIFGITGSGTISRLPDTFQDGRCVELKIETATPLTITHGTADAAGFDGLFLPGAASITTAQNDTMMFRYDLGSTRWDMVRYTKADGMALIADPTASTIRDTARGLTISNNGSTSLVDIDADEVILQDGVGNAERVAALNVTANTAASGVNGIDTGSVTNTSWYYIFVISDGVTPASLLSLSVNPTLPGAYTKFALVGACLTDGSSQLYDFRQIGKRAWWQEARTIITSGTAAAWTAVILSQFFPDTAKLVTMVALGTDAAGLALEADGRGGSLENSEASTSTTFSSLTASDPKQKTISCHYDGNSAVYYQVTNTGVDLLAWSWEYE